VIRDTAIVPLARRSPLPLLAVASLLVATSAMAQAEVCVIETSAIGAHLSHTRDGFARRALDCSECHPALCSANQTSNLSFGALASTRGAAPAWDPATRTCAGVYCHGATLAAAPASAIAWSYVDPALVRPPAQQCALCHGYPPPGHPASATACRGCHAPSILSDGSVDLAGGHHVDGVLDFTGGGGGFACDGCHAFPPPDPAHLAHFGLPDAGPTGGYGDAGTLQDRYPGAAPVTAPAVYAFGCGNCHPLDAAKHMNDAVEVTLYEATAPAGSLKARAAATAAYEATSGTCVGVYCHSSGQQDPAYAATPGWASGARLGCAGCHANPPAYPSGGAGAPDANSHLNLAEDGYEFGHFLGMPGPTHASKHGGGPWGPGEDATPITCQTCHYDTTDPGNVGPSGFYYLDTTGSYALPGGDPGRGAWLARQQCGYCHSSGGAATGTGRVLPLRHVNGARDVVFDPREALPAISWLPAAPNTPTAPYWLTSASWMMPYPDWVTWNGATVSFGLAATTWDPATKACSNVGCHLAERPVWGTPYLYTDSMTCNACHPM
jgi:predicted CxxxxCH...CXXCH cytochrome family protein